MKRLGCYLWLVFRQHLLERCKTPFMLLVLGGVWMIIAGLTPLNGFGLPFLFCWHSELPYRISSCLGLGLLIAGWCQVSFLLDTNKLWLRQHFEEFQPQQVLAYLFVSAAVLAAVVSGTPRIYGTHVPLPADEPTIVYCLITFLFILAGVGLFGVIGWIAAKLTPSRLDAWVRGETGKPDAEMRQDPRVHIPSPI